ncbi:DUF402 domain-containing protein [Microbacterium sp. GXF0217]
MRLPIGSRDVSTSGGNAVLIGRRGEGWQPISTSGSSLEDAVALLETAGIRDAHIDPAFADAVVAGEDAPVFTAGDPILWRYGRYVETARVIRDDERGLVVWIASGSARLESVPADGRSTREVPLDERFSVPWVTRESTWRGQGIVRVAPAGRPWSIWYFRNPDGTPAGAYVNIELPHRRVAGDLPGVFTRDLVLDLVIDLEHPGSEDIWLKDADELEAAVTQGRFTAEQADAVRVLAEHACRDFTTDGFWLHDEGWDRWKPDAAMDEPLQLPADPVIDLMRQRSGRSSIHG